MPDWPPNHRGRGWVRDRDGVWRKVADDAEGAVLRDGEGYRVSMMMMDARPDMPSTTINDAILTDARRSFEDSYGPGAGCLATFSERAKALHLIGDVESGEVFRVEQAMVGLRNLAFRMQMAAGNGGSRGLVRDSADDCLQIAAFLTRMADRAHGRADALRAGQRAVPAERFDPRQQQRIADARAQGDDGRVAYETHKARLSNAWMGNR